MNKKKIQVTINDTSYQLISDEPEEHLHQASSYLDELIRSTIQAGVTETQKASVLVALQLASRLLKTEEKLHKQEESERRLVERIERESLLLASLS